MLECTRQIMARKFHYGNKKNDSAPPATGDAVQRAAGGNRGGRRGGRGKGRDNSAAASAAAKYAPEKLSMTLGELGVSEELAALLATRNIRFAKDLVTRTEREMFKVQGFNKKMLLALKRSLDDGWFSHTDDPLRKRRRVFGSICWRSSIITARLPFSINRGGPPMPVVQHDVDVY